MIHEIISATGHRRVPWKMIGWCRRQARQSLTWYAENKGTTTLASGLAMGWDLLVAEEAMDVGLNVWAHIPFPTQTEKWKNPEDVARWQRVVDYAGDRQTIYAEDYAPGVLHQRNTGLVECGASLFLVLWDPSTRKGGTVDCLKKVVNKGTSFVHFDPHARWVERKDECKHVGLLDDKRRGSCRDQ